jgi:hypothetical protein
LSFSQRFIKFTAYDAPATPKVVEITASSVILETYFNQTAQRNFCSYNVEFECYTWNEGPISETKRGTMRFKLDGLKPYTEYSCTAAVESVSEGETIKFSSPSEKKTFMTKEGSEFQMNFVKSFK